MDQTASGTTVCCLLCRGWIKDGYKEGNIDRFKSHMENEHALVFNLEYMLASSLMDQGMVEEVASSVKIGEQVRSEASLLEEQQEAEDILQEKETLGETSSSEVEVGQGEVKKEVGQDEVKEEVGQDEVKKLVGQGEVKNEVGQGEFKKEVDCSELECPTCSTRFMAKTMFNQHISKGCKKEIALKSLKVNCPHCPKMFNSKMGLKCHVGKKYQENSNAEIVSPIIDKNHDANATDLNESKMTVDGTSFYESAQDDSFNSTFEKTSENMDVDPVSDSDDVMPEITDTPKDTADNEYMGDMPSSEVNTKSYVCSLCEKASSMRQNFKVHLNKKHPDQPITDEFLESCKSSDPVPTKPFPCSFPLCSKSYSSKISVRTHEVRDHGAAKLPKGGRRKSVNNESNEVTSQNPDASAVPMDDIDDLLEEGRRRAEELARIKAEYYGNSTEDDDQKKSSEHDEKTAPNQSFLTDGNIEFNENTKKQMKEEKETDDNPMEDNSISSIDTSQSKYFQKNPNVFANARGKSLKLFSEEALGLPEGWKMRSIEREGKDGSKATSIKHYLTPDQKVLKTGLAVIEYLRLEGKLNPDQLLEVRTTLKISDKKLRDLYDD